ncbi:hypothetical protein ACHAQH_003512 [Verticillium albo-atrum]
MQHRLLVFLALVLVGTHLAAAGFLDNCGRLSGDQWVLSKDGNMGTYCNDDNCNAAEFTVLNLNECFANVDGKLVRKFGVFEDFLKTCRNCRVIGDSLGCECRRSAENGGKYVDARINVNRYVDTWNGYLRCNNRISKCVKMSYRCKPDDWPDSERFFEEGEVEAIEAKMGEQARK